MSLVKLDQLKKIVLSGGYDAESKAEILEIERELTEAIVSEKLVEIPAIKKLLDYFQHQIEQSDYLLSHSRKLTELERIALFERKDICQEFASLFNGSKQNALNDEINRLLDMARSR